MRRKTRASFVARGPLFWVWTAVFSAIALLLVFRSAKLSDSLHVLTQHHRSLVEHEASLLDGTLSAAGTGGAAAQQQDAAGDSCSHLTGSAYLECWQASHPRPGDTLPATTNGNSLRQANDAAAGAVTGSRPFGSGSSSDGDVEVDESGLERLFLFVGILSGRGYRHRRLAVREAWANRAQNPPISVCKFILSEDERTPQVQKELETHGDIVFVKEKTNYKSILYKTFFVLEWAVENYAVDFVLKTDDDAFVNVPPMVDALKAMCETDDCRHERLYVGRMAKSSEVLLQPGHKWNNIVFHNHTGLKTYPNYMMGGGYVVSGDVSRALVEVNQKMKLKFTPIEDATLGFWLMAMDLRHVDHKRFYTWALPCCFKPPVRREGQRIVTRFQLADEFERHLCSDDPWLILHKIDSPTKMRYIGNRVLNCTKGSPVLDEATPADAAVATVSSADQTTVQAVQQQADVASTTAAAGDAAAATIAGVVAAGGAQEAQPGNGDAGGLPEQQAAAAAAAAAEQQAVGMAQGAAGTVDPGAVAAGVVATGQEAQQQQQQLPVLAVGGDAGVVQAQADAAAQAEAAAQQAAAAAAAAEQQQAAAAAAAAQQQQQQVAVEQQQQQQAVDAAGAAAR